MTEERYVKEEIRVRNHFGIHVRPASLIVKSANKFISQIKLIKDDVEVDAKSILGILMLGAPMGSKLVIEATGEDSKAAVEEISRLFMDKFGEE